MRAGEGRLLSGALAAMKISVAKQVVGRWKRMGAEVLDHIMTGRGRARFWQKGGGFDRNVRSAAEFTKEVRYIHRNPVERGLVLSPQGWAWSSVHWWMGDKEGQVPCDRPPGLGIDWEGWRGFM
jgi:putative transposase